MNQEDLNALTDRWHRDTNSLNAMIDDGFKGAQDHAYALGVRRGREDLIAIRAERDHLAADNNRLRKVLETVFLQMDDDDGEAPGHCHAVKGRWDKDGSECELCAAWEKARAALKEKP